MLGIEDKYVTLAYLLCLGSTLLCVLYGLFNWNKGDVEAKKEDIDWAAKEKKVEEEL